MCKRILVLVFCLAAFLPAAPRVFSADNPSYHRVVLLLWDTSQSMVMRKKGPTATVPDLQRLQGYVSEILFTGMPNSVASPDFQRCQDSFLTNPQPLVDSNTLLIAHRFHTSLEPPQGRVLPPEDPQRETLLWQFLPKSKISVKEDYTHLETELVRPLIDAFTQMEKQGFVTPAVEQIFLVIVSDNLTETTIPPASLPQEYIDFYYSRLEPELLNKRVCTVGVQCSTKLDSIHRILINVYQISKQTVFPQLAAVSATPTPASAPTFTPVPTVVSTPTPYTVAIDLPADGLGISVQDNRVVSDWFTVQVDSDPQTVVPAPLLRVELKDEQGTTVSQGRVKYDQAQSLPARSYAEFDAIQGSHWPVKAVWSLENGAGIAGIHPAETSIHRREFPWPLVLIGLVLLLALVLFWVFRRLTRDETDEAMEAAAVESSMPVNQAKIRLTLDPSYGSSQAMEFYLSSNTIYKLGQPIQGQHWFEGVDCVPMTLRVKTGWLRSPTLLLEAPMELGDNEKSSTVLEIPLTTLPARETFPLRGSEPGQEWEMQIEAHWISAT